MSLDACADLVRRGDPDRYLTVLAAPLAARARLLPIYAFNIEVSRAPWVTAEPMIAEMRLQFWRDVLEEIAGGGPVRPHEVATPLAGVLDEAAARALDGLVAARRADLERAPFADAPALWSYLDATTGTLTAVAGHAIGAGNAAGPVLRRAGRAAGLAAWLRAVPALGAAGRQPLPDPAPDAVAALAREGLDEIAGARRQADGVSREAHPALWPGRLAGHVLARAARDPGRVTEGRLEPSEARRRASLLWAQTTGRW